MQLLVDVFLEPLSQAWFQRALIGGSLVAVVCGVIGCFIILRRITFLGDGIGHAMVAGLAGGYLFMRLLFGEKAHAPAMLIGSLIAAVVTVGMIGFVSKLSRIKEDAAIGITYTGIFALGGAMVSVFREYIHVDLLHFLMGQVLAISEVDLWFSAAVAVVVLSIVILAFRHLQITTFDPVMAAAIGVPVLLIDYTLTVCTSLVVVSAVNMVGVVMVIGLLVTPAASAYLLCDRLGRMLVVAAALGVSGVVGGVYLSVWLENVAGGPAIVLFTTAQFLVVFTLAPRYGLIAGRLRRARMVPQPLVEDVLRSIQKAHGRTVPVETVLRHVHARPEEIRRALKSVQRRGMVEITHDSVRLTDSGRHEARRILRAHRLWETYLQRAGLPESELHERAHQLEHVHDEQAIDYLEDKLGHPLTDPHGKAIPEDFVHLIPGHEVDASLLREGHRGTITRAGPRVPDPRLQAGVEIQMGPRRAEGTVWTVILPDGSEIPLDHPAADDLIVQLHAP